MREDKREALDLRIRHFIYLTFVDKSRPPSTHETASHFGVSCAEVEEAYKRLATAHHIALAHGSYSIWMAHPFSALPTNYITEVKGKRYWGN
jgi:hypothetical protein